MEPIRLSALSPSEYHAWFEEHCSVLHHRTPFHQPAWMETAARGVQFETRYIGVYEGDDLLAATPGFLTRRGPFTLFGSPLRGTMTSSLGPTSLRPLDLETEMTDLIKACQAFVRKEWDAQYIRFTVQDGPMPGQPFDQNWEHQLPKSYRLNLSPGEEGLWNAFRSGCRRNIRRAQKENIEVAPFRDPQLLFQMVSETYRRHGTTTFHQERFFHNLLDELIDRDLLWSWSASYEGKVVAACLFLHDDQEVHFVSGGSLPENGSLPTSYILHWTAIQTAVRAGLKIYHSDASQVRTIDQFKESFSPDQKDRYTFIWSPSHVRLAQKAFLTGHSYVRKLRRFV